MVAELLLPDAPAAPGGVVLKTHRSFAGESASATQRASREFAVLCRLGQAFAGQPEIAVPRPLLLDGATVVMEPCPGRRLDDLLRQERWSPRRDSFGALVTGVRRAGCWLRMFQEATASERPGRGALDRVVAQAHADLEAAALGGRLARRLLRAIERLAGRAGESAAGQRLVGRHGDFWPGNVFASSERVHVIDHEGFDQGLAAEDPACFLLHLDLYCSYPGLGDTRAALRTAFLQGYGDPPERATDRLCRLAAGLAALRRPPGTGRLHRWWWRRALRQLLAVT